MRGPLNILPNLLGFVLFAPALPAQPLTTPVLAAAPPQRDRASAGEAEALATQLRALVLQLLPDPLFFDDKKWNQQKTNPRGKVKNHGRWMKVRITAKNPDEQLVVKIDDMVMEKNRKTFTINLVLPAQVDLERQTWRLGVRIFSGSTRARLRLKLSMQCELVTRVEQTNSWVPDMIVRLRVLNSACSYDDFVVEHTAGVGGETAKVLGELMLGVVKQAKPSFERKMIDKANAAIIKAGDSKEVRISLADWLNGKPAVAKPKK